VNCQKTAFRAYRHVGNAASMKTVFWLGFGNLIALFQSGQWLWERRLHAL